MDTSEEREKFCNVGVRIVTINKTYEGTMQIPEMYIDGTGWVANRDEASNKYLGMQLKGGGWILILFSAIISIEDIEIPDKRESES